MRKSILFDLFIFALVLGLSVSAGAVSMAYGLDQTCGGVTAGFYHTCVLKSGGNVDCYGSNSYGQANDYTGGNAIEVTARGYYTCVLTSGGNVDCYGRNDYGQANDYNGGDAIRVATGNYHTCVLTSGGNVDCYGYNFIGQAEDYTGGDAVGVAAGGSHTCILTSGGNVDCYGNNGFKQAEDYMGGDAIGISAGNYHTCVLTSGGNVDCYGCVGISNYGQANDYTNGDAVGVATGASHTCVLTSGGNVHCYGDNEYGQANDYNGGDAIGVFAGGWHTCVLKSGGNVDCYGSNSYGQANDYTGGDALCYITSIDSDGDGVPDNSDNCPNDPAKVDPGACGCGTSDADLDGDGYRICDGDCDNGNAAVNPAAVDDDCDGVDNDCDDVADDDYVPVPTTCGVDLCSNEGALDCIAGVQVDTCTERPPTIVYYDGDSDGYGDPTNTQEVCTLPVGYVFIGDDCDDSNPSTNPGANDTCDTGHNVVNRDCNPGNDMELDCLDYCGDTDVDGYVTEETWTSWGGTIPSLRCPWIVDRGDCNDQDAGTNPAAAEVCDDADNNCDGEIDEGCPAVHHKKALEIINKMHSDKELTQKKITASRQAVEKSLGNRHPNGDKKIVWLKSDKLARKHGHKAYHYHKKAVKELMTLEEEIALLEQALQAKEHIKEGARKLAKKAIDEAPAGKDKQKAQEKYDRAAQETSSKKKIQRYKSAWKYVNKVKTEPSSCIDEISLLSPDGDVVNAIGDNVDPKMTVFTDTADNKIAINTSCNICISAGQIINGWEIIEIIDDGTLGAVCSE